MKIHQRIISSGIYLILILLLAGCSLRPTRSYTASSNNPAFRPPTLVPTSLPTLVPTPTVSGDISITPESCVDILRYIEDITIPDGTVVSPGMPMDKRWRVENNGTCNWEIGYTLDLVAGPEMGVSSQQALYPARSGSQAIIRILFTAPKEPGTYRSAWQAHNSAGQPFGDPIYIEIFVEETIPAPENITETGSESPEPEITQAVE